MRLMCLVVALTLSGPAAPEFSDPQARALFEGASDRYAAEDFEGASEALRQAYEREPLPILLYSRAQVERRMRHWATAAGLYEDYLATEPPTEETVHARRHLAFTRAQAARADDDCERAVELYDAYLDRYPDTEQAQEARRGRDACREAHSRAEKDPALDALPPLPVRSAPAVPSPDAPADRTYEDPPRRWYRSVAGGVLASVAVAGAATGTTLVALAYRDQRLAADEPGHDGATIRYERARSREIAGTITLAFAGASLLLAGMAYGLAARKRRRSSVTLSPGGATVRF